MVEISHPATVRHMSVAVTASYAQGRTVTKLTDSAFSTQLDSHRNATQKVSRFLFLNSALFVLVVFRTRFTCPPNSLRVPSLISPSAVSSAPSPTLSAARAARPQCVLAAQVRTYYIITCTTHCSLMPNRNYRHCFRGLVISQLEKCKDYCGTLRISEHLGGGF